MSSMQSQSKNQRWRPKAVFANEQSEHRGSGTTLSQERKAAIKQQIEQRIILLLVLINENSYTSASSATSNMFQANSGEPEALVIAKSQREITALVRGLVWLESDAAGQCVQCGESIEDLGIETVIGSRRCDRCEPNGGK